MNAKHTDSPDALRSEMNDILLLIHKEGIKEDEKGEALIRLSEIADRLVAISKTGDSPLYVINLLPKQWTVRRSYCIFQIKAKPDEKLYGVTEITGKRGKIDTGRGGEVRRDGLGWQVKLDGLYYTAKQITDDIIREVNGDLPPLQAGQFRNGKRIEKTMGVFVSETPVPNSRLIAENIEKLKVYYTALVDEGNILWQKTHDYRQVSDLCREACDFLGISTEWHQSLDLKDYCPGCGTELRAGTAKCLTCGAIMDYNKAYELGMLSPAQVKAHESKTARD